MQLSRLMVAAMMATAATARAALVPADLLLIINKNVPESASLAAHYAEVRHIAADRILPLDTSSGDDLAPAEYDTKIAAPVRQFLSSPAGKSVRCLVLFYGLPLRVSQRPAADADRAELTQLRRLSDDLDHRTPALADELDGVARSMGLKPAGGIGKTPVDVRERLATVGRQIDDAQRNLIEPSQRQKAQQQAQLFHQHAIDSAAAAMSTAGLPTVAARPEMFAAALAHPRDASSRSIVRTIAMQQTGAIALQQIVQNQIVWIDGSESDVSIDSELSLVLAGDYPFYRWQPNLLYFQQPATAARVMMVSRIDAPTPQIARRMIDDSIAVEAAGLDGKCVIDSRGLPATGPPGGYGWYDQLLRDTAKYLKADTKLDIVSDDRAQVLLPGSVQEAALYCGWYSLRQYIASCKFRPGAVGYHVASLELVSLHAPGETGWVANLLKDGVDATLGPVSEPYLSAFPRPDQFFPLLLTGKLTLAETYWATCPMASWKMILIGDPLYRPYCLKPALAVGNLPAELQAAIEKVEAAQPTGR